MPVLTVPACQVQPFDSITEGRVVIRVEHSYAEVWSLFGHVRKRVVDIESVPARTVVADTHPKTGEHLHDIDRSDRLVERFLATHELRVRPAPIDPCACGV